MNDLINSAGWEQWSSSTPNTDGVFFAEYNSSGASFTSKSLVCVYDSDSILGPGSVGPRAPFATLLSNDTGYAIADVLGDSWMDWVDGDYYMIMTVLRRDCDYLTKASFSKTQSVGEGQLGASVPLFPDGFNLVKRHYNHPD